MMLALSILAMTVAAGWFGFVLAHRPRKQTEDTWQRQVELTRLLIRMQPKR